MVLNGVLALSLDSGMLLACSKRVHDVGFSFDAPAPHAPSSSGTSSSKCSTGSSSDAPPSTQESDLGCSLSSCNVASNPLSDAELDALLGLPTAQSTQERAQKAETNISSAHSGTDAALHHHQASSFEPMQFAASLFAIYKNASHSNYHNHTRTAQGDDVKTLDNGCTVTVRAPTIRFIKQWDCIWHFMEVVLDAASAATTDGRRRFDGAVNVLIVASLHARLNSNVVDAILDAVIEATAIHLSSSRSSSSAFDSRINEAIGKHMGLFIDRCLGVGAPSTSAEPVSDIVVLSASAFDVMMLAVDPGSSPAIEYTDNKSSTSGERPQYEGMLPPIVTSHASGVSSYTVPTAPGAPNTKWSEASEVRTAEEASTPTKAPQPRAAPGSAPSFRTAKWHSFGNMLSTKSVKSLFKKDLFTEDETSQSEVSTGVKDETVTQSKLSAIEPSSSAKAVSWKFSRIYGVSCNVFDDNLRETILLFGHWLLAEGFEKKSFLWSRAPQSAAASDANIALHEFLLGNAVGTHALWAHNERAHVVCFSKTASTAMSIPLWRDVLAVVDFVAFGNK